MPKTQSPSAVQLPHGTFITNAQPDVFDSRDLNYRPKLEPLPASMDRRPVEQTHIYKQDGSSCTGHAIAAMINTVLTQVAIEGGNPIPPPASPYMLYRLARRYDEFPGEEDAGSSLRGGMKGWLNHGCTVFDRWGKLDLVPEPDFDNQDFIRECSQIPLGAFYRVNPYRLDDMQSAITELHAVCASAAVHSGWITPIIVTNPDGKSMHVIQRSSLSEPLGGHAFAIVGYNEVGFLVQNSWGSEWGDGGFATLPYDEWLDSAYDAWVARPGVPKTPFAKSRTISVGSKGTLGLTQDADLFRLRNYVVDLGNEGRLSTNGKFTSSPLQIDRVFSNMQATHDEWQASGHERHVLLYAHGGLVSEQDGLETAHKQLDFWLNNHIYPISFVWETGPKDVIVDQIEDFFRSRIGVGFSFDFFESIDRLMDKFARTKLSWAWAQMKDNADKANLQAPGIVFEPGGATDSMAGFPGATLVLLRLATYLRDNPSTKVHLVGHSAGANFMTAVMERLAELQISTESLSLMAPAVRVDDFVRRASDYVENEVKRVTIFNLTDRAEKDDTCTAAITWYHKSLLYWVSQGFEIPKSGQAAEVPLLGMQKFYGMPLGPQGQSLLQWITGIGGELVFGPTASNAPLKSDSACHGCFSTAADTLNSIAMRVLDVPLSDIVDFRNSRAGVVLPKVTETVARAALNLDVIEKVRKPVPVGEVLKMLERQGYSVDPVEEIAVQPEPDPREMRGGEFKLNS